AKLTTLESELVAAREKQKTILDASRSKIDKLKTQMKLRLKTLGKQLEDAETAQFEAEKQAVGGRKRIIKEFYKTVSSLLATEISSKDITMDDVAFSAKEAIGVVKKALRVFAASSGGKAANSPTAGDRSPGPKAEEKKNAEAQGDPHTQAASEPTDEVPAGNSEGAAVKAQEIDIEKSDTMAA
ncbi:hypothetical protein AAMO2058_000651200, partial [Amorphochlora amoebiformis]